LLSLAAANRDPARHPEPDRLNLDRPGAGGSLTFGHGPHYCLGAALARLELVVALTALLDRLPGLRLAVRPNALRWTGSVNHRQIVELPVSWLVTPTMAAPRNSRRL
jgi:cytochrome P450